MILANLPCLEYCCPKGIVGGEKYSYGNGVAVAFAGSHTDGFDVSAIVGRDRNSLKVSVFASKHGSGLNVSAVAGTSISVGHGYAQSSSFTISQSPSYSGK